MIVFSSVRPGAWLRDDIADILTAVAMPLRESSDYDIGYMAALIQVGHALGIRAEVINVRENS